MKIKKKIARIFVALIIWVLALTIVQTVIATDHQLKIVSGPLIVQPNKDLDNRMIAAVLVSNNGPDIALLIFRAVSDDGQVIALQVNGDTALPKYSVKQYDVEFINPVAKKVTGHLIIEAQEVDPAVEALTLEPGIIKSPAILWLDKLNTSLIILISFLVGFVAVSVLCLILMARKFKTEKKLKFSEMIQSRLSGLKWDFTQNWASTLVAGGGILTTVVGSKVMPENPVVLSTQGFQLLNILFPVLVVIAPFLLSTLNALGREPKKDDGTLILDEEMKTPLLTLPYVIGSAMVTWAVIGELMTLAVLFQELNLAKNISNQIAQFLEMFMLLLCLLGLYYAMEKIVQTSLGAKTPDELKKPADTLGTVKDARTEKKINRPVYLP